LNFFDSLVINSVNYVRSSLPILMHAVSIATPLNITIRVMYGTWRESRLTNKRHRGLLFSSYLCCIFSIYPSYIHKLLSIHIDKGIKEPLLRWVKDEDRDRVGPELRFPSFPVW